MSNKITDLNRELTHELERFEYYLEKQLENKHTADKVYAMIKNELPSLVDGVKNKMVYQDVYSKLMIKVSRIFDTSDMNQYLYKSPLLQPRTEINVIQKECAKESNKINDTCRKVESTFLEFQTALLSEDQYDLEAAYPFVLLKWIESKMPNESGKGMENVYDYHVLQMARIIYFRVVYALFEAMIKRVALNDFGASQNKSKERQRDKIVTLSKACDMLFTTIVHNEINRNQNADENDINSLEYRYNQIRKLSKHNKDLTKEIAHINNDIFELQTTLQSNMNAKELMKTKVLSTKIFKYIWLVLLILTICASYLQFDQYQYFAIGMSALLFIIQLLWFFSVDLAKFNLFGIHKLFAYNTIE